MDAIESAPFADYPAFTGTISAQGKTDVLAAIDAVLALIPDQQAQQEAGMSTADDDPSDSAVTRMGLPDFNLMPPSMVWAMREELQGLRDSVAGMTVV